MTGGGPLARVLDSGRARRLRRSPVGRRVLRSRAYRGADLGRRALLSRIAVARDPHRFDDVHTACVLIGHVKSGGSLLGAMLDTHPDALIADELDLVHHVASGFGRDQVFHLVARGSHREMTKGRVTARRLDAYSLAVDGGFQGRSVSPRVVGDTRAGPTTRRLDAEPGLLDHLDAVLAPATVRYIHVVREPHDPVSAMVRRGGRSVTDAIADYEAQCDRLVRLRARIPDARLATVHYEHLVADPVAVLTRTCHYLGLDPAPPALADHIARAAAIVDPARPGERTGVTWKHADTRAVRRIVDRVPFLEEYRSP